MFWFNSIRVKVGELEGEGGNRPRRGNRFVLRGSLPRGIKVLTGLNMAGLAQH